jgi:signal transduction histidine kinase
VDASRTRDTGGAGLGLAIGRTIAEAHGGTLEVRPNSGKGVVFTLTLPAR